MRHAPRARAVVALSAAVWLLLAGPARGGAVGVGARAPELAGGPWIGSAPLTIAALRGRVTLIEFWTYG